MVRRLLDVGSGWVDTSGTPEIRVKGQWLESLGFPVGTGVLIVAEEGRIVITALTESEEAEV